MNIPQIMTTMSLVKEQTKAEHSNLEAHKTEVRAYSQMGLPEDATQSYKDVVTTRARIKRLVALRAALKADYYQALSLQRAERLVANGALREYIVDGKMQWSAKSPLEVAKREAEEKCKVAREAVQLQCGGVLLMNVQLIYDDQSYSVVYTNDKGVAFDVGYGDKDTSPEGHADNIYEILSILGVKVTMTEAT